MSIGWLCRQTIHECLFFRGHLRQLREVFAQAGYAVTDLLVYQDLYAIENKHSMSFR